MLLKNQPKEQSKMWPRMFWTLNNVFSVLITDWLTDTRSLASYLTNSKEQCPLEKIIIPQLVKIFPALYGTKRFITAFTRAYHLSLSSSRSIRCKPYHPISWKSISKLLSHLHLGFPSGLFLSGVPTTTIYAPILCPMRATLSAQPNDFISSTQITYNSTKQVQFCSSVH